VFNPSGDSRGRIHHLGSSQPDNRNYHRVQRHCLRGQRVIVNAWRSFLAAAKPRRHPHLPTLVLHHAAAGTLLGAHLRIGDHAGHRWGQACYQQQNHHTELAKATHFLTSDYDYLTNEANNYSAPSCRDCKFFAQTYGVSSSALWVPKSDLWSMNSDLWCNHIL
jgi:hypothetical protein